MNDVEIAAFGEGLYYEDRLPLRWRDAEEPLSPGTILTISRANEQLLRNFAAIEEIRHEGDDDGASAHDIQRLEYKVDLLMDMVGRLLSAQVSIPDAVPVRLGADAMQWTCPAARCPAADSLLRVEVYLHHRYPSPLVVVGAVESVVPEGGEARVTLRYVGMGEGLRCRLEKTIFRQHRRLVAQSRQAARGTG